MFYSAPKSHFNLKQEAPKTHQVSSCGDAQGQDSEIQGKTSNKSPAAALSASNGRQPLPCRYFRGVFAVTAMLAASTMRDPKSRTVLLPMEPVLMIGFADFISRAVADMVILVASSTYNRQQMKKMKKRNLTVILVNTGILKKRSMSWPAKGVKPWDDDANAVLHALHTFDYGKDFNLPSHDRGSSDNGKD